MATKAEIVKELAEPHGITASMKSSKADLQTLLEDAKAAAQDAEEVAAEIGHLTEFKIKQPGQIRSIEFGEDHEGQVCTVTRYHPDDNDTTEIVFHAESYDDVLVSLEVWLKEERRRWR